MLLYRPHYKQAIEMCERIVNRHAEDLATLNLNWYEHKDEYGVVYCITPWVDAQFKGIPS